MMQSKGILFVFLAGSLSLHAGQEESKVTVEIVSIKKQNGSYWVSFRGNGTWEKDTMLFVRVSPRVSRVTGTREDLDEISRDTGTQIFRVLADENGEFRGKFRTTWAYQYDIQVSNLSSPGKVTPPLTVTLCQPERVLKYVRRELVTFEKKAEIVRKLIRQLEPFNSASEEVEEQRKKLPKDLQRKLYSVHNEIQKWKADSLVGGTATVLSEILLDMCVAAFPPPVPKNEPTGGYDQAMREGLKPRPIDSGKWMGGLRRSKRIIVRESLLAVLSESREVIGSQLAGGDAKRTRDQLKKLRDFLHKLNTGSLAGTCEGLSQMDSIRDLLLRAGLAETTRDDLKNILESIQKARVQILSPEG